MITIVHEGTQGRKRKWVAEDSHQLMEVITAFFGEGTEIKPRNPWGPKGMPSDEKRRRLMDQLATLEAKQSPKPQPKKRITKVA